MKWFALLAGTGSIAATCLSSAVIALVTGGAVVGLVALDSLCHRAPVAASKAADVLSVDLERRS